MAQPIQEPGRTMARDDAGYETARCETVWRTNMPDRFPDRIVQANSVGDVVAAVRAAKAEGWQVGVRSGGHSWSANHVRDGGVLIDVSRLKGFTVDKSAMTATVEPGLGGSVLVALVYYVIYIRPKKIG